MKKRILAFALACVLGCSSMTGYAEQMPDEAVSTYELESSNETEPETEPVSIAETVSEIETEAISDPESVVETEQIIGAETIVETEPIVETVSEIETEMVFESEQESELAAETITETEMPEDEEFVESVEVPLNQEGALVTVFYDAEEEVQTMAVSSTQATLEKMFEEALENEEYNIDISSLGIEKNSDNLSIISAAISNLINSRLDYFYLSGGYSYSYGIQGIIKRIIFKYDAAFKNSDGSLNTTLVNSYKGKLKSAISDALSCVDPAMSDLEKVLALHEWMVLNCEYDYTYSDEAYTAYGAMVNGSAVCQGYAAAFGGLLQKSGISNYFCPSDSMGHAWNLVKVDGAWYHVDVTWDDPSFTSGLTYYSMTNSDKSDDGYVSHAYFMKSDAEMTKLSHTSWNKSTVPTASVSGKYTNYCFYARQMEICYIDGYWYYLAGAASTVLYKSKINGTSKTSIALNQKADYIHCYNEKIYYSYRTDGVYEYNPATGAQSLYWNVAASYAGCRVAEFGFARHAMSVLVVGSGIYKKVSVTKSAAVPSSLAIVSSPTKVQYNVGESLNLSGLKLVLYYSDMSTKEISSGYSVSGFDSSAAGVKTVTVKYNSMQDSFKVTVVQTKTNLSNCTVSLSNTSWDYTGKVIKPTAKVSLNGKTLTLNTDYILQYTNNTNVGTAKVTVVGKGTYTGEKTVSFTIKPEKVTSVKAAAYGEKRVRLSWNPSYGATGYRIYVRRGTSGSYVYLGRTTSLSFVDKNASDTKENYYRVRAYITSNSKTVLSVNSSAVHARGICKAVASLKATAGTRKVILTWTSVSTADGYMIYGKRPGASTYSYIGSTTKLSFTDSKASKTSYTYYRIYPYHINASGKKIKGLVSVTVKSKAK